MRVKHMLMDAAPGDTGGTVGGSAPAAEPSLLTSAAAAVGGAPAAAPAAAAPGAEDPLAWIPEKYRVAGAEGKVDVQASAMKINEARAALEKRMGVDGAPPETAEGYKSDAVLADLKTKTGKDVALPPELLKDFGTWAHGAKLTQAQYDSALGSYVTGINQMVESAFDNAMASGKAELTKVWGAPDGEAFKANMGQAAKAFNTYMPQAMRTPANMDAIGNHPMVLQLLAAVGKELKEDSLPAGQNAGGGEDVNKLMNSQPYWDAKHAEHASVVAKVNEYFAKGGKRA